MWVQPGCSVPSAVCVPVSHRAESGHPVHRQASVHVDTLALGIWRLLPPCCVPQTWAAPVFVKRGLMVSWMAAGAQWPCRAELLVLYVCAE